MNKKIAIVVWSKTGNTRLMANALKEGLRLIILTEIKLKNIR